MKIKILLLLLMSTIFLFAGNSKADQHSQIFYEKENHTIVDILYGTDRKTNSNEKWENYYSGERGKLKFGVAEVSIPKKHKLGEMERPVKWWFYEQKEKIGEHVIIRSLKDLPKKIY